MLRTTRQTAILDRLRSSRDVSVSVLAEDLGVSVSTIRRDLDSLDADGLLTRVRGGGSAVERDDIPFREVISQSEVEKDRIARAAAELVVDGSVIILDIGTTTVRLAERLRGRRLTVITASIAVVDALRDEDCIELVVLGGVFRSTYLSLVGALTEQALGQLRASQCFLSTSGVREGGYVMDTTGIEVPVKRAMISAADEVVLLADVEKFPGTGLLSVTGPEGVDVVVTNKETPQPCIEPFVTAGSRIIRV